LRKTKVNNRYLILKGLLGLALVMLAVLNRYIPVFACTVAPPTPWFSEQYEVLNTQLPEGISFSQRGGVYVPYFVLDLINNTGNPIQFIGQDKKIKLITESEYLIITDSSGFKDDKNLYFIEPLNKLEDNRPDDVDIPLPQLIEIPMLISDETFLLQVKISYSLNDMYINNSVYVFNNACSNFYINYYQGKYPFINIFSITTVCLVIIALLIVPVLRRRSKKNKNP
jgi:hypothetical protein